MELELAHVLKAFQVNCVKSKLKLPSEVRFFTFFTQNMYKNATFYFQLQTNETTIHHKKPFTFSHLP